MSNKKNSQDLLLRQAIERAPHYGIFTRILQRAMLPVALLSDMICYVGAVRSLFDESLFNYLPIALVGTSALDIPAALAGELSSQSLPKGKVSRRRWVQVAVLMAVFAASYLAYLFFLSAQLSTLTKNGILPVIGRSLLPAITSAACFATSYQANPDGQRAALLECQMIELQQEISQVSAEVERSQEALAKFDPDRLDALDLQYSMHQAELAELEARLKMRSMLLEILPTQDAVAAFLMNPQMEADIDIQTAGIRGGNHPMPTPQPVDGQDRTDQHESVAFPA